MSRDGRLDASIRRLRRRATTAGAVGRGLAWGALGLCASGAVALLARALLGWPAERAAWLFAPLATLPLVAFLTSRRRAPSDETCAAWLDLRSNARGLVLAASERADARWSARTERALDPAPALPRFALRGPLERWAGAAVFAVAALLVPVGSPAPRPAQAYFQRVADELAERVDELALEPALEPETQAELEQRAAALRELADAFVEGESFLEAADLLRGRIDRAAGSAALALDAADGALGELAGAAASDSPGVGALLEDAAAQRASGELPDLGALRAGLEAALGAGAGSELDPAALRALAAALAAGTGAPAASTAGRIAASRNDLRERLAALRASGALPPKAAALTDSEGFGTCSRCGSGTCDGTCAGEGLCAEASGHPGRGGVDRGRGDAQLTWGDEAGALDRFREHRLPPGAAPDLEHSAPAGVSLRPPEVDPTADPSAGASAAGGPSNVAWQRRLPPRQREAVRRFFQAPAKADR